MYGQSDSMQWILPTQKKVIECDFETLGHTYNY